MSAGPSSIPFDHPAALPSDASTSKDQGGVEARPSSRPSSSSFATIARSSLPFPFNHPSELRLFFDPTSTRAVGVSEKLQTICERFNKTSPITLNLEEATHLVLEEATELNEEVRDGVGVHQHLVCLQWIIKSTFSRKPLDEKAFPIEPSQGGLKVVVDDVREEEDQAMEEEEKEGGEERLTIIRTPRISFWGEEEDENLARFLATRPAPYRQTDFVQYVRTHRGRTDEACARRYRFRRGWFDRRIQAIKFPSYAVAAYVEPDLDPEVSKTPELGSRPRPKYVDKSVDHPAKDDTVFSWRRRKPRLAPLDRGTSPSIQTYSEEEQNDLVRLLADGKGSLSDLFALFAQLHFGRSLTAVRQHYYAYRAHYDRLSRRGRPADQDSESSSISSSSSDPEDPSDQDERPVHRHVQHPRPPSSNQPRLPLPQQHQTPSYNVIASSSRPTSDLKRPSSVGPGSSPKKARVTSNPSPTDAPSSSHHSHHQQHAPSYSHSHPAPANSALSSSSSSSSSQNDQPLELPSFLQLGAKPSPCSPTDQWCYFCGRYGRVRFELLQLVTRNEGGGDRAKCIETRLGCDACARVYRRRLEAKAVVGLGVMERIEYASNCVLEEGLEIRREAVEG